MSKKRIELSVIFVATYIDPDNDIPADQSAASEEMQLTLPNLDSKFVVLPKVLEGITERVIKEMDGKVMDFYRQKAEKEKQRKQEMQRPSFWREPASNGDAPVEMGVEGD